MGFFDFILDVADAITEGGSIFDKKFKVKCTTLEIFEIGTQWRGTARIHGAGEHVRTVNVDFETFITLPSKDDDAQYTRRGLLRKQLRDWVGKTLAEDGKIAKETIVLNASENCLSAEGFGRQVDGKWLLVDDASDASHFCAFKLFLTDANDGSKVGHDKLDELFMAETLGYVSSVDVSDGF